MCRPRLVSNALDLLNATNTKIYGQLLDGWPDRPYYFMDGDLGGVPRTLKFKINAKF